ncbi:MAG: hypothetical protein WC661_18695 [Opitutaceae bacterium]|jgi:hypothetical protein
MFHRLIFDDWVVIFPLIAFITAASVYVSLTWRALRMRPAQINHFASLPFNDESSTTASRHDDAE